MQGSFDLINHYIIVITYFNELRISQRWCAIETNFQWTICLVSIPLSKVVKPISEVTMTLIEI